MLLQAKNPQNWFVEIHHSVSSQGDPSHQYFCHCGASQNNFSSTTKFVMNPLNGTNASADPSTVLIYSSFEWVHVAFVRKSVQAWLELFQHRQLSKLLQIITSKPVIKSCFLLSCKIQKYNMRAVMLRLSHQILICKDSQEEKTWTKTPKNRTELMLKC